MTITVRNSSGEALDARTWAGQHIADGESVELDGEVTADGPDAVVVQLAAVAQPLALPRSLFTVTGHETAPAAPTPADAAAAQATDDGTAPRDLVTLFSAAGATFSPGAATEGNPLGLFVPNDEQPPADPPAESTTPPADPPAASTRQRRTTTTDGE